MCLGSDKVFSEAAVRTFEKYIIYYIVLYYIILYYIIFIIIIMKKKKKKREIIFKIFVKNRDTADYRLFKKLFLSSSSSSS
jgi:hypothetical protein